MKNPPKRHQTRALEKSDGRRNFAYLMRPGTGKTYVTLADAERAFIAGKIDAMIVFCPTVAVRNWTARQIPLHLEVDCVAYPWGGLNTKKDEAEYKKLYATHHAVKPLFFMAINFEAAITKKGAAAIAEFMSRYRVFCVVDESTRIKNPNSARSKAIVKIGRGAEARRILTGTPMPRSPLDLYSQFDFLKQGLLGTTSYRAFTATYAVLLDPDSFQMRALMRKMNLRVAPQIVARSDDGIPQYKNLDKLSELVQAHSFICGKEALDLPPKRYQEVYFKLSPQQQTVYNRMKNEFIYSGVDLDDVTSFVSIAARTKLRQIASGFVMIDERPIAIDGASTPRLEALADWLEDFVESTTQAIIWCSFDEELSQVAALLEKEQLSFRVYSGATGKAEREEIVDAFQRGEFSFFVGNPAACGIAIDLTAAECAFFYSSDYDNEKRTQAEDRNHRMGTTSSTLYVDLIGEGTLDEDMAANRAMKDAVADYVIDSREEKFSLQSLLH